MVTNFCADPRYFQIFTLSVLLVLQMLWADFGPEVTQFFTVVSAALITQALCSRIVGVKFDVRSPLITALSISILFKAGALWVYPLCAVIAIASKFCLRMNNRHLFNPANFGIVVLLLFAPDLAWVSPGQWGSTLWFGFLLTCLAFFVLYKVAVRDMAFLFLGMWSVALIARALWLGDPLSIPLHQLQNGALLIFAFFMISDPKTIPAHFKGRFVFAVMVCALAFVMQFVFQIRESLFYALACICLFTPILNALWQAPYFEWKARERIS